MADRAALIDRYAAGYDEVVAALNGATDDDLDRRPAPGEWSAREVVHHLADSETMSTIRLRRLLAEDAPEIAAYDEAEWARRLPYDRAVAVSLDLLRAVRLANLSVLATLADDDWMRGGTHSEHDAPYTVERWLDIYAEHAHDHARQIREARAS